jgi:hypothetical protein
LIQKVQVPDLLMKTTAHTCSFQMIPSSQIPQYEEQEIFVDFKPTNVSQLAPSVVVLA